MNLDRRLPELGVLDFGTGPPQETLKVFAMCPG